MLKVIRNIQYGWIFLFIGFVVILSGISMIDVNGNSQTLLCFDQGCVYIQGMTSLFLGLLTIIFGIYMILRK